MNPPHDIMQPELRAVLARLTKAATVVVIAHHFDEELWPGTIERLRAAIADAETMLADTGSRHPSTDESPTRYFLTRGPEIWEAYNAGDSYYVRRYLSGDPWSPLSEDIAGTATELTVANIRERVQHISKCRTAKCAKAAADMRKLIDTLHSRIVDETLKPTTNNQQPTPIRP